jgi:hypothetical protein
MGGSGNAREEAPRPTRHWTPSAIVFLVLSIVGPWTFNLLSIAQLRDFVGDWAGSGPAVSSLTVDLLVTAAAGSVFMIIEGRRLGMRLVWLYVVLAGLTAFACTFPFFLAMRARRMQALRMGERDTAEARSA